LQVPQLKKRLRVRLPLLSVLAAADYGNQLSVYFDGALGGPATGEPREAAGFIKSCGFLSMSFRDPVSINYDVINHA